MNEQQIRTAAGGILYDESCAGKPDDRLFTREYWAGREGPGATTGGRGQVLFIHDAGRRWVLRHYRRGGWIARWVADGYFWLGEARTRSFSEWRVLFRLHSEGFPVPAPVAARYVRSGLVYRADLITQEIPDSRTLADRITTGPVPLPVWRETGVVIARLQQRGVHHADLNAHNILLDVEDRVYLIDFDRARIRKTGAWQQQVLARLKRSLEKIRSQRSGAQFGAAEWEALMEGYGEARKRGSQEARKLGSPRS
jgi:3-deoxy-D-manno-octulosonic acid kinase